MNTRGRAERVYLILVAPISKGLPGQRLDVALHKIYPHIYEQNSMSRECHHSSCTSFVYRQSCPGLMSVAPSGRRRFLVY